MKTQMKHKNFSNPCQNWLLSYQTIRMVRGFSSKIMV